MADIGMTVSRENTQGGRIGGVTKIEVTRGKEEYEESRRLDILSKEDHMTVVIDGKEDWQRGVICLPFSVAKPLAKAMLAVAEYAKKQEIALPD